MISRTSFRAFAMVPALLIGSAMASFAGVDIVLTANIAPPPLPVYTQPICPGVGYLWTPGYWANGPVGYYWVPGVWVQPPSVGVLWTPGYWGFVGGVYRWNAGYWGPHVGFYGGINYGFGYGGVGFFGGEWRGGAFFYNHAYANVGVGVTNVYERNVTINNYGHAAFNGPGGIQARPTAEEMSAMHEQHVGPTGGQESFRAQAASNPAQRFSANGGHPGVTAAASTRDGFGRGNEVNRREGNQQSRVNQGVRSGQMTPGETRNVERRDSSINREAQSDRAANGGRLTGQERKQINQRENNVSKSIYNDKHNATNDAAAAKREGRSDRQVKQQAKRAEKNNSPHPKEDHPNR